MPRSAVLHDPNHLSELAPWDLRFQQLEAGRMLAHVAAIEGRHVSILSFRANLRLHQVGEGPKGRITLGLPVSGRVPKWRGNSAEVGSLLSFGSGDEFDGVSSSGFHGLTFSIDEAYFDTLCSQLRLPNEATSRTFGVIDSNPVSVNRTKVLHLVSDVLRNRCHLCDEIEEEIALALALSTTENDSNLADRSWPVAREVARRRAIEAMHGLAADAPCVSEICAASGVGWRTMDRAFKEQFGIGPKAYLGILRLSRVRDELVRHGPDRTVASTASRWGFIHMSQFAKDYRRHFGELPSETRERGPRSQS